MRASAVLVVPANSSRSSPDVDAQGCHGPRFALRTDSRLTCTAGLGLGLPLLCVCDASRLGVVAFAGTFPVSKLGFFALLILGAVLLFDLVFQDRHWLEMIVTPVCFVAALLWVVVVPRSFSGRPGQAWLQAWLAWVFLLAAWMALLELHRIDLIMLFLDWRLSGLPILPLIS